MLSAALLLLAAPTPQAGWSAPVLETALNSADSDAGPHLSADGLTVHFASFRGGSWDLWSATRASRHAPWGAPVLEAAASTPDVDDGPFLTADGLELWFGSLASAGMGGFDVMRCTRPTPGSPWGPPGFVIELNSSGSDSAPSLTDDRLEVYFLTTGHGAPFSPNNAIFRATRASAAVPFGPPAVVSELLTPNTHRDVHVSGDGLTLVWTEFVGSRMLVYAATRLQRGAPFGAPAEVTEFSGVGTSLGVYGISLSREGNEILLAAGFPIGSGAQEIMSARFDGLTHSGIASSTSAMRLHYRDTGGAGKVYGLACSFGNAGFAFGSHFIPLDRDVLFLRTRGTNVPPFTAGFRGVLDAHGEASGTIADPPGALTGRTIFVGGVTLDPAAPDGIRFVAHSFPLQFQ